MSADRLTIAEADYHLWRHHPVTKAVLQYIIDYREILRREALERWEGGGLGLVDQQEMRGRVLACREIAELEFESIRAFYAGEKIDDATQGS